MPDAPVDLIENILPSNRVHLLAAISSGGKSRWANPALIMWASGMPVLGLKSHPVPWCMVCGDRPISDARDMLRSIGFQPSDINIIPAFGKHHKPVHRIMLDIEDCGAKLVLWEGFDLTVRLPNNQYEVSEHLSRMTAYCEEGLTILGTVGIAKLKPHETYENPRQLVAGSSIWERATSTNFIIQATHPGDIENGQRIMYVCLKNSASFAVLGQFDDYGILHFDSWENRLQGDRLKRIQSEMRSTRSK